MNNCVCCGEVIPEGRQVCPSCEAGKKHGGWISVKDRLPGEFISVLVYMPEEAPMPTVREGYLSPIGFMIPALLETRPVTHWAEIPDPPKVDGHSTFFSAVDEIHGEAGHG